MQLIFSNIVSDGRNGKGRIGSPDEEQEAASQINQNIALAIAGNQFNLLRSYGSSVSTVVGLPTLCVCIIFSCFVSPYYKF